MAGTTLAEAETQRQLWLNAMASLASGKSYTIGNRSVTRYEDALKMYEFWDKKVQALSRGGLRFYNVIPG